ncbi:hypothetical protein [Streptomyces hilarionis]|nr:hypothetical protein [Streptomyces hilarionis]
MIRTPAAAEARAMLARCAAAGEDCSERSLPALRRAPEPDR